MNYRDLSDHYIEHGIELVRCNVESACACDSYYAEEETTTMRKVIAAFKISADGKYANTEGYPDWVKSWPDDYGSWLTTQVDACVLGGLMYPMYEQFWTQVETAPSETHPMSGSVPSAAEVEWSGFAVKTPHFVVSRTLKSVNCEHTDSCGPGRHCDNEAGTG